jgi:hypothetical protein
MSALSEILNSSPFAFTNLAANGINPEDEDEDEDDEELKLGCSNELVDEELEDNELELKLLNS